MATSGLHFSKERETDSTGDINGKTENKTSQGKDDNSNEEKIGHHMPPHAPCNNPKDPKEQL